MLKLDRIVTLLIITLLTYLILGSCANTSAPPMGGPKDTIPPVLLRVSPDSGVVNMPISNSKIILTFDEYVVLKDQQKELYLSPPQKRRVETKIKGKSIIASFSEPLDSNRSYILYFGNSIQDNNEGNKFYNYSFPFSTGAQLDTFMLSGTISHASNLMPAKNIVVALYKEHGDSVVYNSLPSAIAKSDEFGYFVIRNIPKRAYSVYAFEDVNNNYKYDPGSERVAFLDSLFTPTSILQKGMAELAYVTPKDTLLALSRPHQLELYLFKEENSRQFIREAKRVQQRMAYIAFSASNPTINSLEIRGFSPESYLVERSIKRDSVVIWLTDTTLSVRDSLRFEINFDATDTSGALSPYSQKFALPLPKVTKEEKESPELLLNPQMQMVKKRKDLLEFNIEANPTKFERSGFILEFEAPLAKLDRDSIYIESSSPKGDKKRVPYVVENDSLWSRIVYIKPKEKLLPGFDYSLIMPHASLIDIYKRSNDSIVKSVSLPNDQKLSKIALDIVGCKGYYIVELTNITRDKVFDSFRVSKDTTIEFKYLTKGKYSIKITEDLNGNGITDTGDLSKRIQPERVRLYTLPDGNSIITLPESTELTQVVDINTVFNPN